VKIFGAICVLSWTYIVCMWAIVQYVYRKHQQDAHFSLMIWFNYIVFDMFWTTKCSSSGRRLYKQLYGIFSCI